MNLQALYYFKVASDTLNFTKASEKLYVSQQSISTCIRKLEKELGKELFTRGKKMTLTYAGLRFKSYVEDILDADQRMRSEMSQIQPTFKGNMTVALNETRAFGLLPKILPQFNEEYPRVSVSVIEGDAFAVYNALENKKIDIAIGMGMKQPGVTEERIMKDRMCLLVPENRIPDELNLEGTSSEVVQKTLSMVKEIPFVMLNQQMPIRQWADQFLSSVGIVPNILMETTGIYTMYSLIKEGMGIGFCQETMLYSFREELEKEQKVLVFPITSAGAPKIELSFYHYSNAEIPSFTYRFVELAKEYYMSLKPRYERGRMKFQM